MHNEVTAYYYSTGSGRLPVKEFIDCLDFKTQRKFFFAKELLEEFGNKLPYPHARYVRDSIFELRFKGQEGSIRVLYFFFHQDKAIFTNGFIKKTDKTPDNELKTAIERRENFLRSEEGRC